MVVFLIPGSDEAKPWGSPQELRVGTLGRDSLGPHLARVGRTVLWTTKVRVTAGKERGMDTRLCCSRGAAGQGLHTAGDSTGEKIVQADPSAERQATSEEPGKEPQGAGGALGEHVHRRVTTGTLGEQAGSAKPFCFRVNRGAPGGLPRQGTLPTPSLSSVAVF